MAATAVNAQPACLLRSNELQVVRDRVASQLTEQHSAARVRVTVTVSHTAAQLYLADQDSTKWRLAHFGVPVIIDLNSATPRKTLRYIAVWDYATSQFLWRQQLMVPLPAHAYLEARNDFHTFRGEHCAVGLLFAHAGAAASFRQVVIAPEQSDARLQQETNPFAGNGNRKVAAVQQGARVGGHRHLSKADISGPANFVHVSHIGLGDLTAVKNPLELQKNETVLPAQALEEKDKEASNKDEDRRPSTGRGAVSTPTHPRRRPPPPPPANREEIRHIGEEHVPSASECKEEETLAKEGENRRQPPLIPPRNHQTTLQLLEGQGTQVSQPQDEANVKEHATNETVLGNENLPLATGNEENGQPEEGCSDKNGASLHLKQEGQEDVGEKSTNRTNLLTQITSFNKSDLRKDDNCPLPCMPCHPVPTKIEENPSKNLLVEILNFDKKELRPLAKEAADAPMETPPPPAGDGIASVFHEAFAKMMEKFKLTHQLEKESEEASFDRDDGEGDADY